MAPCGGWRWWSAILGLLGLSAGLGAEVHQGFDAAPDGWALPAGWQVSGGSLTGTANSSHARLLVPGTAALETGSITVSAQQTAGETKAVRFGVIYRATDADDGYFALFRGDGAYWLGKLIGGKPVTTLTGMVGAIRTTGPNLIKVSCDGARQTVAINDTHLITRSDGTWTRGAVGLWVSGTGAVAFDDLTVTGLPAIPVAPHPGPRVPAVSAPPAAPAKPAPSQGGPAAITQPGTGAPRIQSPGRPPAPPRAGGMSHPAGEPSPASAVLVLPGPGEVGPRPQLPASRRGPDTPSAGAVLFSEDFEPPKYRWNEDAFRRIAGGELRIKAVTGYKLSGFPYSFADYAFNGRTRALSAQGGTYGLVSRLQPDGNSGYLFVIRDPDTFAVARLDGGKPVLLRRGQAALATDWNRLEVRSLGTTHTFRVNGAVVATFSDDRYPRGGVGLWVDEHRDAAFDDLLVEGLASETSSLPANGDSTPVPRQSDVVLLEERFDPPQMHWQQDAHREIRDGALQLSAPAQRFIISGVADQRYVDYAVTTECERLNGPAAGRVGLVVRLQSDGRTGYVFAVDASSSWVVLRFDPADQAVELARGEAAWRPGVNTLAARCQGDRLSFAVNGASVVSIRDPAYAGGGFGLYVDNGTVARYDNILALKPAP